MCQAISYRSRVGNAVTVRRVGPDDWRLWRTVRLAALADAPYAFGSTLAREETFDEANWRARLDPRDGVFAIAMLGTEATGIIGGLTVDGPDSVLLIAAWVSNAARGRGVGDALIADVLAWARETGRATVRLRVADGNEAARKLFLRNGFVPTGEREPLESEPTVGTEFLTRSA